MNRIRNILASLPDWILSMLCVLAIAWLTLAPRPLGDNDLPLFPGADKVAHAIMFGGLTFCILLDIRRKDGWRPLRLSNLIIAVSIVILLGGVTEILQDEMGLGRGGDILDLAADTAGSLLTAAAYRLACRQT